MSHHLGHKASPEELRDAHKKKSTHGPRIFLYAAFFDSISFIFRFNVAIGKRRWLQTTRNFERPICAWELVKFLSRGLHGFQFLDVNFISR